MNGYATGSTTINFKIGSVSSALADANAFLGKRDSRKIGHNTYLVRNAEGAAVRFHSTDVLTIKRGAIVLNSGGYRTYTTKERLNGLLPSGYRLSSFHGVWYFSVPGADKPATFADGLTIRANGKIVGAGNAERDTKLRKEIHAYAGAFARAAVEGKLDKPSGGDCWYCLMHVVEGPDKGKSLGDASGDVDHLRSHMKERYFVPSLLVNAAKARGNRYLLNFILPNLWGDMSDEERKVRIERDRRSIEREVKRTVRQYLGSKLGLALR